MRTVIAICTPSRASCPAWASNIRDSLRGFPNSFTSIAPETVKRSVMLSVSCA